MTHPIPRGALVVLLATTLAGCGTAGGTQRKALSERQRDSVISRSSLPGAGTVGRALGESDAATQRAASLDSLTQ